MDLDNIGKNKINFERIDSQDTKGAAFFSLKIGLNAYFKTYRLICDSLDNSIGAKDSLAIDNVACKISGYTEAVINIWIHLQHFFELEVKRVLREENELLASEIKDAKLIYKLIKGNMLSDEDTEECKSIEFTVAMERLNALIKDKLINNSAGTIFYKNAKTLHFVNRMRNAILHRGRRIIKYSILDQVMCEYILPIISQLMDLTEYKEYNKMFFSEKNKVLLTDLIDELIKVKSESIDYSEVAKYKEFALCKNNATGKTLFRESKKQQWINNSNNQLKIMLNGPTGDPVFMCPCCNEKSLVKLYDIVDDEEMFYETDNGTTIQCRKPIYRDIKAICSVCGFTATRFINDKVLYNNKKYKLWD